MGTKVRISDPEFVAAEERSRQSVGPLWVLVVAVLLSGAAIAAGAMEVLAMLSAGALPVGFEDARGALFEFRLFAVAVASVVAVGAAAWWVPRRTEFGSRRRWLRPGLLLAAGSAFYPFVTEATIRLWNLLHPLG